MAIFAWLFLALLSASVCVAAFFSMAIGLGATGRIIREDIFLAVLAAILVFASYYTAPFTLVVSE